NVERDGLLDAGLAVAVGIGEFADQAVSLADHGARAIEAQRHRDHRDRSGEAVRLANLLHSNTPQWLEWITAANRAKLRRMKRTGTQTGIDAQSWRAACCGRRCEWPGATGGRALPPKKLPETRTRLRCRARDLRQVQQGGNRPTGPRSRATGGNSGME